MPTSSTANYRQRVSYLTTGTPTTSTVAAAKAGLPTQFSLVTRDQWSLSSGGAPPRATTRATRSPSSFPAASPTPCLQPRPLRPHPGRHGIGIQDTAAEVSATPLVWSQTRLHMQKAWLATTSEMVSSFDDEYGAANANDDYQAARRYSKDALVSTSSSGSAVRNTLVPGGADVNFRDPSKDVYDNRQNNLTNHQLNDDPEIEFGQYEDALELGQNYVSQLTAYNYGDRNLDGVEFTYVMPRGVEPKVGGTIEAPDDDDDLDADAVDYYGKVVMQVNADGLSDPIIVDVVGVTGNVVLQDFALTPNEPVVLGGVTPATEEGGDDVPYTFPEGDYWIVIKEVGTTGEGLPFATGEYTYNVLVTGEDGKQTVERRTTPYKPLAFHVTAHEGMVAANPSETTDADGTTTSTGVSASVSDALKPEKKKVYAEDDGTNTGTMVPVKLTRYTGEVINGQTTGGVEVITINKKNYVRDENGKYVACSETNRFVEIDVYDPSVPSQVNAELTLDRIEHDSTVTVQVTPRARALMRRLRYRSSL